MNAHVNTEPDFSIFILQFNFFNEVGNSGEIRLNKERPASRVFISPRSDPFSERPSRRTERCMDTCLNSVNDLR